MRELLSHVLPHLGEQIRVINAVSQHDLANSIPQGQWLIVSEALPEHIRGWQSALRQLGVIVLGHGGSAVIFRALEHGANGPEIINNLSLHQLAAVLTGADHVAQEIPQHDQRPHERENHTTNNRPSADFPSSSRTQIAFA
jgi:hypothetical protein